MVNFWKESFLPWRYPRNWIRNLKNIPRCVKWSYQRITKGYCEWDCWSLCDFLLEFFPGALEEFKNSTHSTPIGKSIESWREEIDETIYKFLMADENNYSNIYEDKYLNNETMSKLYWDVEKSNQELMIQMKNEAFDWIKENFWDLWD